MINFQEYDFDPSPVVWQDNAGGWLINLTGIIPIAGVLLGYHIGGLIGMAVGISASMLAMYFATTNIKIWIERAMLATYGSRLENIYEVSVSPGDQHVYRRAETHREWLRRSENKNAVKVYELIFREGEYCNETIEQFTERVALFIQDDRSRRHRFIRDNDRVLYLKYMKGQVV
ncbi:MAG: hypothetical protein KDD28_22185 [Phaeodactylibacter sp.]|nr:hypothetical protein [Phaeodactylibacter sp.]